MDPFVTLDAARNIPDPYALIVVAAARSRALIAGDAPRVVAGTDDPIELALNEIACGAITEEELKRFLPASQPSRRLLSPN